MTVNELLKIIQDLKAKEGENEVGLSEIVLTNHDKGMSSTLGFCVENVDWYDGELFVYFR